MILLFLMISMAAQTPQDSPLQIQMAVSKIVMKKIQRDGKWILQYQRKADVQEAKPGEILEYTIRYTNISQQILNKIQIIGPIPANTYLQKDSIRNQQVGQMYASADQGKTYQVPPLQKILVENGKSKTVLIPETEWTHLKWLVPSLNPLQSITVRYWVVVR